VVEDHPVVVGVVTAPEAPEEEAEQRSQRTKIAFHPHPMKMKERLGD
jgi:hypothetical protein